MRANAPERDLCQKNAFPTDAFYSSDGAGKTESGRFVLE